MFFYLYLFAECENMKISQNNKNDAVFFADLQYYKTFLTQYYCFKKTAFMHLYIAVGCLSLLMLTCVEFKINWKGMSSIYVEILIYIFFLLIFSGCITYSMEMDSVTIKQHTHINNIIGKGYFEHRVQFNLAVPKNILMFLNKKNKHSEELILDLQKKISLTSKRLTIRAFKL